MSRRKQSNPKPAKRESELDELANLVQLPLDILCLKELDEDANCSSPTYAIFAKKELAEGETLGNYKGKIFDDFEESPTDAAPCCFKVNRFDGCSSNHVMLEDDGHWLKLVRSATTIDEANICLKISDSDVICAVVKAVGQGVELRVTCEVGDQSGKISDRKTKDKITNISQIPDTLSEKKINEDESATVEDGGLEKDTHSGSNCSISPPANEMLDSLPAKNDDCEVVMHVDENCDNPEVSTTPETDYDVPDDLRTEKPIIDNERNVCMVSPPIDPGEITSGKHLQSKNKQEYRRHTDSVGGRRGTPDMDDHCSNSASEQESADKHAVSTGSLFKCPYCTFFCYRQYTLTKHMKIHETVPSMSESEAYQAPPQNYCGACNIQFMSSKTYQVHRQVYCKTRRNAYAAAAGVEAARMHHSTEELSAVVPGPNENAFILGSNTLGMPQINGLPAVIQPQAIFAAISTNPLILVPCNIVNGQTLVAQNGIIPSGTPIILPPAGNTSLENGCLSFRGSDQQVKIMHPNSIAPPSSVKTNASRSDIVKDANEDSSRFEASASGSKAEDDKVLNLKKRTESETRDPDLSKKRSEGGGDGPLDLTVRKRKTSCIEMRQQQHRPVLRRRNSFTSVSPTTSPANYSLSRSPSSPDQTHSLPVGRIVGSPTGYSSEASTSSALGGVLPINGATVHGVCTVAGMAERSSPVPPVLLNVIENGAASATQSTLIPIGPPPPKLLKHGNNRCEDCNIVFYKYDNYLAHKKHYCAYRRRQLAASQAENYVGGLPDLSGSDDNNSCGGDVAPSKKISISDDKSFVATSMDFSRGRSTDFGTADPNSSGPHKNQSSVFRCDACGVKFSTADNLNAHQTYYCSRKKDSRFSAQQALRRNAVICDNQCQTCGEMAVDGHEDICCPEEWKCNYCDVVCPSLKTARRHLLTHSEIRGFCCIICGYRGNTLRGMRTHVYEHLNGNASQIEDILASSVVVDPYWNSHSYRNTSGSDEESCPPRDDAPSTAEDVSIESSEHFESNTTRSPSAPILKQESAVEQHSPRSQSGSPKSPCVLSEPSRHSPSKKEYVLKQEQLDTDSEGSPKSSGSRSGLNATAFCDVVIKTEEEDDDCEERILPERSETPRNEPLSMKDDDETADDEEADIDVDDSCLNARENSNSSTATQDLTKSVIRRVTTRSSSEVDRETKVEQCDEDIPKKPPNQKSVVPKKRSRSQTKTNSELKYCKSCDISFHHLSNFIAHKKFYCVSRVIENFAQEAAAVQ